MKCCFSDSSAIRSLEHINPTGKHNDWMFHGTQLEMHFFLKIYLHTLENELQKIEKGNDNDVY